MKLLSILVLVFATGVAHADGSGSAEEGKPAPPAPVVSADASALRKTCTDAMNADPSFAKAIVDVADKDAATRRMDATEKEHLDAAAHIAKDQKHVVLAYGAMWIIAAAFVVFLWRRQQALKAEIAALKRDLEKEASA